MEARVQATIESVIPTATVRVVEPTPVVRIISQFYKKQIEQYEKEEGGCLVSGRSKTSKAIKNTIRELSSHDLNYWRSYYRISDLSATDVQDLINYLENAAGTFERSCSSIKELNFRGAAGIKVKMDELYRKNASNNGSCHTAESMTALARNLRYENIYYLRGLLGIPELTEIDVRELSGHLDSEAGRYARLCAQGQ